MPRLTLSALLLLFAVPAALCQSARSYLVTATGDTLYAAVRFNARLADNNREVQAFVNGRAVHYAPGQVRAYYNGLHLYETQPLGDMPVFLQRHTAGHVNLYYCDETVLADLIRNHPRLGDQIGYSLRDALKAAVHAVRPNDPFAGRVPVLSGEGKSLRIFDPHMPQRKQELAAYLYDFPGTEALLAQDKLTPETYEQLVMAYNQWRPNATARLAEQERNATGF